MTLPASEYIGALRRDSTALADAASSNLGTQVASCPEWTARDLLAHIGEVHRFWSQVVEGRLRDRSDVEPTEIPPTRELVAWFAAGAEHLADVLEQTDGSVEVWTWSVRKDVDFVRRRTAQETAMHRWDAQDAAGKAEPIESELARDGIDEFFDVWLPAEPSRLAGRGETIHLHQTDGEGEWVVAIGADGVTVERGHFKADTAVRGTASELLLMLWRRIAPSSLEVFGNPGHLERFVAWLDLT